MTHPTMYPVGIGVDVVANDRFSRWPANGRVLASRVCSAEERTTWLAEGDSAIVFPVAAKEAAYKAVSKFTGVLWWHDIELASVSTRAPNAAIDKLSDLHWQQEPSQRIFTQARITRLQRELTTDIAIIGGLDAAIAVALCWETST